MRDYTETRYLNENDEGIALFVNTSKGFHEQDVIQRFGMNALVKLNQRDILNSIRPKSDHTDYTEA